jgi:hypothetical protein
LNVGHNLAPYDSVNNNLFSPYTTGYTININWVLHDNISMTFICEDNILLTANALITGATEALERKNTAVWRPVH